MKHEARGALKELIIVHKPNGFDWMNFALTKRNKYTYHHIQERKNGGKVTKKNGAILTVWSHRFLNLLEKICPDAYEDLQNVFYQINSSELPMNDYFIVMIDTIICNIFNGGYEFTVDVDLDELYHSEYLKNYTHREKIRLLYR